MSIKRTHTLFSRPYEDHRISHMENTRSRSWINILLLFSTIILFILYYLEVDTRYERKEYRSDFLAYWSVGKVIDNFGYSSIYNFELNEQFQREAMQGLGINLNNFIFFPVVYLSVFLVPFRSLSRLDISLAYWVWSAINWVVLVWYFLFFYRQMLRDPSQKWRKLIVVLALIFSFPTFFNSVWGQVNVLLAVSMGEFIRNVQKKRFLVGGLWIGLLTLKFPLLILLVPALIFLRNFRVLKGLLISSASLFVISSFLVGKQGIEVMFGFWMGSVQLSAPTSPNVMMNWRMLGYHLNFLEPIFSWMIVLAGIAITLYLVWLSLKTRPEIGSSEWIILLMGIVAGTCAISWHSHIHMALVLLPFFIFSVTYDLLNDLLVYAWIIVPAGFLMSIVIIVVTRIPETDYLYISEIGTILSYIYLLFNFYICVGVFLFLKRRLINKEMG